VTDFLLPTPQVDPNTLPPLLLTSDPNSFARNTLRVRIPAILRETIALNDFAPGIRDALEDLYVELTDGRVRGLQEEAPDAGFWQVASAPYIGRSWLDVPWYWAEAFFYRRLLEATRYFQPGPWAGCDPFAAKKRTEWAPDAAPAAAEALLSGLPADPALRFQRLLHASLWGNRTDLSYAVAAHLGGTAAPHEERSNLLVDDTGAIWDLLRTRPGGRIAIITDNAGTELTMDLALSEHLLSARLAARVDLHLKPQPYFVSDAMKEDVMAGLAALPAGGAAAGRLAHGLEEHLAAGRLRLTAHWAYASSLFFFELPEDLRADLAGMDLVLVKGDANYRRLVGDCHWPPATVFAHVTRYFPAPLAALRTFKAELVVGLVPGEAERLAAEDPDWRINGRRGVIQANLAAGRARSS